MQLIQENISKQNNDSEATLLLSETKANIINSSKIKEESQKESKSLIKRPIPPPKPLHLSISTTKLENSKIGVENKAISINKTSIIRPKIVNKFFKFNLKI